MQRGILARLLTSTVKVKPSRSVAWYTSPELVVANNNHHHYDGHHNADADGIPSGEGHMAGHHSQQQHQNQHSVFRPTGEEQQHRALRRHNHHHHHASMQIFSGSAATTPTAICFEITSNQNQVSYEAMHEVLDKAIKEHNLHWACDVLREMCARDYNDIEERMYFALVNELREQSKHSKIWARVNKILRNSIEVPPRVDFIVDVFHRQTTRNEFAPQIFD